jgi:hypothetical protein
MTIHAATLREVIRYGVAFKSSAALAANTAETVFAAASNTNGAVVWDARGAAYKGATSVMTLVLLAHTSAPANVNTGDALVSPMRRTADGLPSGFVEGWIVRPVFVAASKGLYWLNNVAETDSYRQVLYTLL